MQGDPAVLTIPDFIIHGDHAPASDAAGFRTRVALALVTPPGTAPRQATSVQRAVALCLLQQADQKPDIILQHADPSITAAAKHLSALPQAGLHRWLATHIAAIRAHALTLKDLP